MLFCWLFAMNCCCCWWYCCCCCCKCCCSFITLKLSVFAWLVFILFILDICCCCCWICCCCCRCMLAMWLAVSDFGLFNPCWWVFNKINGFSSLFCCLKQLIRLNKLFLAGVSGLILFKKVEFYSINLAIITSFNQLTGEQALSSPINASFRFFRLFVKAWLAGRLRSVSF